MEETILVGDDLMMGPPSPIIPPEIASHVLEGVDLCDGILRNLFLCKFYSLLVILVIFYKLILYSYIEFKLAFLSCFIGLQINDIEPFCQDEIAVYRRCAEKRVRLLFASVFNLSFSSLRFIETEVQDDS